MANVKISALPTYTGSPADLRWFVMNNSGETTTYKFSGFTSPFKSVGTSIFPISGTNTNDNVVIIGDSTISNNSITNSITIGNNNNISGPRVVSIGNNQTQLVDDCVYVGHAAGGSGNGGVVAVGAAAIGRGNYGISIGNNSTLGNLAGCDRTLGIGAQTSINGSYSSNVGAENTLNCERGIILGTSNYLTSPYSAIIGSNNNISSTGFYNSILGGANNALTGDTTGSTLINTTGITKVGSWDIIIGGNGNNYDNSGYTNNVSIGGESNVMTGTRGFKTIINGYDNKILSNAKYAQIFGGYSNTIDGGDYGLSIIGGFNNTINSSTYGAGILSAFYSTINQCGTSVLVGGVGNTISNSNAGGIFGGRSCSVTNSYEDIGASIWGSWNSTITAGSPVSQIIGGNYNTISSVSPYAIILGGETNLLDNSPYSQILGGSGNTINCELPALERYNTIIGGTNNTIFDTGDEQKYQTIINSVDTTLSNGVDRVTAIGLSGRTINDAGSGTTYVENLKAFRQITSGFYDNGSIPQAGYTINLNNGDKQQITITGSAGNTALYFTGNLAGGRLVLKVINTSTGDLGFADNAPYDWKIPAVYPSASPSATDVYIFESFGDQALWFASQSKNLS